MDGFYFRSAFVLFKIQVCGFGALHYGQMGKPHLVTFVILFFVP